MKKYSQRKDGRYKTRVWDGSYVNGRKHYIDVYSSKSSRDLERKVAEIEAKRQIGAITYDKQTDIYRYTLEWIDRAKSSCEESTKRFYLTFAKSTLSPLKGLSFDNFTYNNIQDLFNEQKDHPGNVDKMKVILKQVGMAAERDRLMPRGTTGEIFERIKTPKKKLKDRDLLTDKQKKTILEADLPLMEKVFVHTLYYTGLRRSEALALTKDDIKDGYISVTKALGVSSGGPYVKQPKSARGMRKVPISKPLQDLYDIYIPTLTDDLLFSHNGYITPSHVEVIVKHLRKATGIKVNLHSFRHNFCTMLCYQSVTCGNISPKKIAELLGDREEMVMNVYSHIVEEKEKVSEAMNAALNL